MALQESVPVFYCMCIFRNLSKDVDQVLSEGEKHLQKQLSQKNHIKYICQRMAIIDGYEVGWSLADIFGLASNEPKRGTIDKIHPVGLQLVTLTTKTRWALGCLCCYDL